MKRLRVEERLEWAPAPDAAAARERARRVVGSSPVAVPRRRRRRLLAALAALLLALGVGVAPAGSAIASWLTDLVDPGPTAEPTAAPAPEPRLTALRAPGRVLVTGRGGAWVIARDGSRVRVGKYDTVAWSPHGLFLAAASRDELRAIETDGSVRWSVTAPGTIEDPVWSLSGYRIAYRVGHGQRVVAGDGTADRALVADVAAVTPAWRPGPQHQLALARRDGRIELWSVDGGVRRWRVRSGSRPVALLWRNARRLVIVRSHAVQVVDGRGRTRVTVPVDGPVTTAVPFGDGVALAAGPTVLSLRLPAASRASSQPRVRLAAAGPVSDLVASPMASMLIAASASTGQWVFLPERPSGRVSGATVDGVTRVEGWETEPLASAPMGDGRQVVLTPRGSGGCLSISGVDELDRQCLYAPARRRPPLLTGPVAQRSAAAPVEVYGTVSEAVDRLAVSYVLDGLPAEQEAVLLRIRKPRGAGTTEPFGVFLAELPSNARNPVATAYDASGRPLMRDGFARIHPHVFIAAGAGDLPSYDAVPWARIDVDVFPDVGDGTTQAFRVAFTSVRRTGLIRSERWRYRAVASTTAPAAGCVNARDRLFAPSPAGRRVSTRLRLSDGEGGDTRWCPGRYRGRIAIRAPGVREIVARFSFRVLP